MLYTQYEILQDGKYNITARPPSAKMRQVGEYWSWGFYRLRIWRAGSETLALKANVSVNRGQMSVITAEMPTLHQRLRFRHVPVRRPLARLHRGPVGVYSLRKTNSLQAGRPRWIHRSEGLSLSGISRFILLNQKTLQRIILSFKSKAQACSEMPPDWLADSHLSRWKVPSFTLCFYS